MKKDLFILNPWVNHTGNNQGAKTDNYWLTKKTICSGTHFHIFKEIIFLSSPTRVNWYWQYWPHFLMFFTTHSIPSLTPSPDVALHAWICHTRSWKRKSDGGNLVVKIFLMSFGIKVFNKNWEGGGCWKYLYSVKCHPLRYLGRCGGSDQVLQVRDHNSSKKKIIANDKQTDQALYVKDQHSSPTQPACWRTPGWAPPSTSPHTTVPEEKIFR